MKRISTSDRCGLEETRLKNAFAATDYDFKILFSEGDSAKEKTNVENLSTARVITKTMPLRKMPIYLGFL